MWVVGAVRSQVDVPIWQKRATRVAACLLAGGPDVPAKADGPPTVHGSRSPPQLSQLKKLLSCEATAWKPSNNPNRNHHLATAVGPVVICAPAGSAFLGFSLVF